MKKLLLSLAAMAAVTAAQAETVSYVVNDIASSDITGEYHETTYKEDGTSVQAYANWQPLESVKLGSYTATFAQTTESGTQPALYTAKEGGIWTIRVYNGCTMTISGADLKGINLVSDTSTSCNVAASTGAGAFDSATKTYAWAAGDAAATEVTFTFGATYRIKAIEFTDDSTTPVEPETGAAIDETFANGIPATWSQVNVLGDKEWRASSFSGQAYASMTGYNGTAPFDQWLVTPAIDLDKLDKKNLSFDTEVNGYGSTTTVFEVYVMDSADTEGNNTKLNPVLPEAPASGYSSWTNSGELSLDAFSGTIYIGFRYAATEDSNYATWCLANVKVGEGSTTPVDPVDPTPGDLTGDNVSYNFADPTTLTAEPALGEEAADGTTGNTMIEVNGTSFVNGVVSVVNTRNFDAEGKEIGTSARLYHQSSGAWSYRFYKNTTTTISVSEGYKLTGIKFEGQTSSHTTAINGATYSAGACAESVWTPGEAEVTSLEIVPNGTIGVTAMTVYYTKSTGVADVEVAEEVPAVYYNLQGVRVAEPAQGLYIVVRGNKVTKELVK